MPITPASKAENARSTRPLRVHLRPFVFVSAPIHVDAYLCICNCICICSCCCYKYENVRASSKLVIGNLFGPFICQKWATILNTPPSTIHHPPSTIRQSGTRAARKSFYPAVDIIFIYVLKCEYESVATFLLARAGRVLRRVLAVV